jgi:hypothetical protein
MLNNMHKREKPKVVTSCGNISGSWYGRKREFLQPRHSPPLD